MATLEEVIRALASPSPPMDVVQGQFDGNQDALERLARGGHRVQDLYEYALDLQYVDPLQDDLFRLVFPGCLRAWQEHFESPEAYGGFVQQFHAALARRGLRALIPDERARAVVLSFFRRALLDILGRERELRFKGVGSPRVWISALASHGTFVPEIGRLWDEWWAFPTEGAAVSAVQYASCLVYPRGGNPVFRPSRRGGGPPCLWSYESVGVEEVWLPENVEALRRRLSVDMLRGGLERAVARLEGHLAGAAAVAVLEDFSSRLSTVARRIEDLPKRLENPWGPFLVWED